MDLDDADSQSTTSLREEQKEETHARILGAALALVGEGGEDAVTIRAVATVAGIAERTVYRHFKTRDVLLESVWNRMQELVGPPTVPQSADALIQKPRSVFPRFHRYRKLVRAFLYRQARREYRTRSNEEFQQLMIGCVQEELEHLDERSLRRRAAIAHVIASGYAWDIMREYWGLSGEEAGEAAAEALEILLNRRRADWR